ncbi:MAG TPA: LytR C-terminal domain-containing protein [Acidimicrobiia bacterium]|nr:LytR C-terminal domain-containing protein [Acidimicrobiia bacterium]
MATIAGVHPRGRTSVPGSFGRSLAAAAARGAGLVAVAVLIGVLLLEATDTTGGPAPADTVVVGGGSSTTTTTSDTALPGAAIRPPADVQVLVLNAARLQGAAGEVAQELQAAGYPTLEPANAPTQAETVVFFKPGFEAEAAVMAPKVSENAITDPLPDPSPFAGTEQADLVVVIGSEIKSTRG